VIERLLTGLLSRAGSEWTEAIAAEAQLIPSGRARRAWLWGGVTTMFREAEMIGLRTVRLGTWALIGAVIALTITILAVYPHAAGGAGGVLYTAILAGFLAAYGLVAYMLTRQQGNSVALRFGTIAGLIVAVLLTIGFFGPFGPFLPPLAVVALPAAIAARVAAKRTGLFEQGVMAGVWSGMAGALTNLVVGMILILSFASRLPVDSDVLRTNHTQHDIIAANVGETLVGYILFLFAGPLAGMLFGMLGAALGYRWRSTQTGS
jgi:hypothetical protein